MNDSITITRGQFHIMLLVTCMQGYIDYSYRYFRISEKEANDLFYDVVDEFWNRLAAGQGDLLLNPMRSVERIAQRINKNFIWKQRLLTLEGLPQGLNCV